MVCRKLQPRQRTIGMLLGSSAAVILRIVFAFFIAKLAAITGVSIAGGLFLLFVATKLMIEPDGGTESPVASGSLWAAVATIAIADAGTSLDNVMAIAGLSHGDVWLMAFGVALSIPAIIAGSAIMARMIERFPCLKWAGAAHLGWTGGGIVASDHFVMRVVSADTAMLHYVAA